MNRTVLAALVTSLLVSTAAVQAAEEHGPFEWSGVERLVAIGDVHGSYDKLLPLLQGTGLIDDDLAWSGGEAHVVFLGDLTDRGPLERPVLDLVRRLEVEAEAVGGRLHVLLGNHEVLNMVGDLRYVEGQGYSDFTAEEQASDRNEALTRFRNEALKVGMPSGKIQSAFRERHPPGFFGRLRAFSAEGEYGQWLLEKPAVVKINGYLFLHGGLTDTVAALGLDGINQGVRQSVREFLANRDLISGGRTLTYEEARQIAEPMARNKGVRKKTPEKADAAAAILDHYEGLAFSPGGPLWYRGNSVENEQVERAILERVLESLDAEGVVVAHTPTGTGRINSRFNGQVIRTDVGMAYGREPMCMVLQNDRIVVYDPRRQGYLSLAQEPPQGERWSDIQEQLPDAQLESFLERAKVVDRLAVHRKGREGEVWSLEQKKLEMRAVFLSVEDPPGSDPKAPVRRYVHEIASYKIDRMMKLGLVPVTVLRQVDGVRGSLQTWVQAAIDRDQIRQYEAEGLLEGLEDEIMRARVFTALIGSVERLDFGEMLVPKERRIMLADNTKAFPVSPEVDLPEGCRIAPDLELGMRGLKKGDLKSSVGAYLSDGQIKALLERRDRILEDCS
jgi:hypothetical protein